MGESHVLQPVRLEERLLPVEARSDTFDTATSLVAAIELPPPSSHALSQIVASARARSRSSSSSDCPGRSTCAAPVPVLLQRCMRVDHLGGSIKTIVFFMSSTVA